MAAWRLDDDICAGGVDLLVVPSEPVRGEVGKVWRHGEGKREGALARWAAAFHSLLHPTSSTALHKGNVVTITNNEGHVGLGGVVDQVALSYVLPGLLERAKIVEQLLTALDRRLSVEEREVVDARTRNLKIIIM